MTYLAPVPTQNACLLPSAPLQKAIALGDEENDVEMLRSVVGVAMGQSSREVRRSAQFTAPSNAHHGVAVALETFCGV